MAAATSHLSLCSSSSSAASLSQTQTCSFFKKEADLFSRFAAFPRKTQSSTWVRRVRPRKSFQLKFSSNGSPLNAVSLQDSGSSVAKKGLGTQEEEASSFLYSEPRKAESTLSITVVGASGDLARKKIFPALFALFYEDWLPENFCVCGYARTRMTDEELRNMISKTLTCRIDKRENCEDKMEQFLMRCFYHAGQYNSEDNFRELDMKLKEKEAGKLANRLFYLSIPPNIFVDVVRCASLRASSGDGWTRVIVEKPFGRDSESSGELTRCLKQYLAEDQIFRYISSAFLMLLSYLENSDEESVF
ncbi:hypothetical protein CRG98_044009 [Punica granatum]|uniref:Glucose-6-phosphate dehydrogenase NAD-binding domain-containing protein n=1 Tax=Punica granatum TaxID=22663 RepID=A0A2I0HV23_PUNGR|nr:hypothetical protein CRG98_044009 [Punica granatum]